MAHNSPETEKYLAAVDVLCARAVHQGASPMTVYELIVASSAAGANMMFDEMRKDPKKEIARP